MKIAAVSSLDPSHACRCCTNGEKIRFLTLSLRRKKPRELEHSLIDIEFSLAFMTDHIRTRAPIA